MKLSMLPTVCREVFGIRRFGREPEPEVMNDEKQVAAFAEAGRIDGVMSATYLFNSARISQIIQGCEKVLDLGCGPATQLAQIAQLNPKSEFLGIDMSEGMLEDAKQHCNSLGLTNVSFQKDDIAVLQTVADNSIDAVISTLALHHLPNETLLKNCFEQIKRVLKKDGALYLVDLSRLKSLESILYFTGLNKQHQPAVFTQDYELSLRAAYSADEFRRLSTEVAITDKLQVISTFLVPVLTIIKSADKPLPTELRAEISRLAKALPSRYRADLNDIRLFFKLSGLKNDPFLD